MNVKTILVMLAGVFFTGAAFAQEAGHAVSNGAIDLTGLGAGLGLGIAAMGGAIGQGKTAAAALEGISRNPAASGKVMTPMIIGLALIESLVIYALIIAIIKIR